MEASATPTGQDAMTLQPATTPATITAAATGRDYVTGAAVKIQAGPCICGAEIELFGRRVRLCKTEQYRRHLYVAASKLKPAANAA